MRTEILAFLKKYDFSFFGGALAIFIIGVLNLYSATHTNPSVAFQNLYLDQILRFSVGCGLAFGISFIDSKTMFRFSYIFYIFNILLLMLVLVLGQKGMGAQRWLVFGPIRFQPSELMKLSLVMALARYYSRNNPEKIMEIKDLIIPGILTLIPTILIVIQPDLGTGLLLILIFSIITFYKRISYRAILILSVIALLAGSVMYTFGLKDYQKRRISTFLNPQEDARGSGYNAIQSQIAIGSGRFLGKGFKKSSQASLQFLPENHTDFVFSIFNEEHGFFGSVVLISLYVILLSRFIWLSGSVLKFFDSVVVIGLMSIFFWHIFINMCMVMGLLPIVGLPLPFMSFGGSSIITYCLVIGIATSISNSRNLF
ncbi:rod shape-determining protein RodA [Bacteriovoracaceae bacterium]|nr:rod shape-determining protein RodA [Bacteriovoracaceae bacterium]